jgi:hypothetical protein
MTRVLPDFLAAMNIFAGGGALLARVAVDSGFCADMFGVAEALESVKEGTFPDGFGAPTLWEQFALKAKVTSSVSATTRGAKKVLKKPLLVGDFLNIS